MGRSRGLLLGAALGAALVCGTAPSYADDTYPGGSPTGAPTPVVSPPSQAQIDDAKNALARLSQQGASATPAAATQVAGPVADRVQPAASRISDETWWTIGAGVLVLLVASETGRIGMSRAKHRRDA